MQCPRCGGGCQIIQEFESEGQDYSAGNGCCGYILFGPIGLLCGLCGKGRQERTRTYWICNSCGNKFRA
ncbi:hypothetical protein [Treponema zioleckii]|uniref:hypothetical protein n=1 Tax=Treponema zioleckii TaxID=331680 RepID=UPI00168BDB0F|nr:hypothetical protein [Treponema zioleckii]